MSNEATSLILRQLEDLNTKVQSLSTLPRLLTIPEAAQCLGVSEQTVRRHLDRREIRFVQEGPRSAKRIRSADLERWIDRNTVREVRS